MHKLHGKKTKTFDELKNSGASLLDIATVMLYDYRDKNIESTEGFAKTQVLLQCPGG